MTSPVSSLQALVAMMPPQTPSLRAGPPLRALCQAIRLEGRIDESLKAVPPAQAGPLNSQGVAVRALQRLHQLSPAYVRHLVIQMDALAALEDLSRRAKG